MSKTETAFPIPMFKDDKGNIVYKQGMTLRDYFAAKAMQGLMSEQSHGNAPSDTNVAEWAYRVADEMLKARENE